MKERSVFLLSPHTCEAHALRAKLSLRHFATCKTDFKKNSTVFQSTNSLINFTHPDNYIQTYAPFIWREIVLGKRITIPA